MVKKIRLDIKPFDDIRIIGINTAMPDYQLASSLNRNLNFSFVRLKNISIDEYLYSFYFYDKGENLNAFNLVSLSSSEGHTCVTFKPKTDYLLIIRNEISDNDFNNILNKIKSIQNVFHAYEIDINLNKKIDVILEYIELHEIEILKEQDEQNSRWN